MKVSAETKVQNAYVSACGVDPSDIAPSPAGPCYKLSALIQRTRRFRFVSDCVQHALVAEGRLDAAVDAVMNPWDIAALVPCVEEAGGVATDLEGRRDDIVWRASLLSSATQELHGEILSILSAGRKL
jgi:histidinol-phosphatase